MLLVGGAKSASTNSVVALLGFTVLVGAVRVNVTIDDGSGHDQSGPNGVSYAGTWFSGVACKNPATGPLMALTCSQNIDTSRANNQTWTGIAGNSSIQFSASLDLTFNGTAIYVYHIIPAQTATLPSEYRIAYALDSGPRRNASFVKTSITQYNQLAFSLNGLNNTQHNLSVFVGSAGNQMTFDYAVATVPKQASSESKASRSNIPAIVGGVLGGLAGLGCIMSLLVWMWRRRRSNRKHGSSTHALLEQNIDANKVSNTETGYNASVSQTKTQDVDRSMSLGMITYLTPNGTQAVYASTPAAAESSGVSVPGLATNTPIPSDALQTGSERQLEQTNTNQQTSTPMLNHSEKYMSDNGQSPLSKTTPTALMITNPGTGGESAAHQEYVTMLESEVDRLQMQLDRAAANDILPSYE